MKWGKNEATTGMAPGVVCYNKGRYKGEAVYRIHRYESPYVVYSLSPRGGSYSMTLKGLFE